MASLDDLYVAIQIDSKKSARAYQVYVNGLVSSWTAQLDKKWAHVGIVPREYIRVSGYQESCEAAVNLWGPPDIIEEDKGWYTYMWAWPFPQGKQEEDKKKQYEPDPTKDIGDWSEPGIWKCNCWAGLGRVQHDKEEYICEKCGYQRPFG